MSWKTWATGGGALVAVGALAAVALADDPRDLRPAISARVPSVQWVRTDTLARWLREAEPPVLLDSRPASEFRVSHLEGAHRVDPDETDVAGLSLPEGRRVVVYCSVGWRSGLLADRLRAAGVDVYNLEGGLFQWANEGRPMVDQAGRATRLAHPYDAVWGRLLDAERRAPID